MDPRLRCSIVTLKQASEESILLLKAVCNPHNFIREEVESESSLYTLTSFVYARLLYSVYFDIAFLSSALKQPQAVPGDMNGFTLCSLVIALVGIHQNHVQLKFAAALAWPEVFLSGGCTCFAHVRTIYRNHLCSKGQSTDRICRTPPTNYILQ